MSGGAPRLRLMPHELNAARASMRNPEPPEGRLRSRAHSRPLLRVRLMQGREQHLDHLIGPRGGRFDGAVRAVSDPARYSLCTGLPGRPRA